MEMSPQSSIKFLATAALLICSCYWQETSPQNKSINNAVESFSQSLFDLGGAGGAV